MKIGLNFFRRKLAMPVFYKVKTDDEEDLRVNYYEFLKANSARKQTTEAYEQDPNELSQAQVSKIFSDVLLSLDYWKEANLRAI